MSRHSLLHTVGVVAAICAGSSRIVLADAFGSGGNTFDIEFVTIGEPGNPDDTTGRPNPAGSVDYDYRIGKHEVSRDMIDKANSEGGLGITLRDMSAMGGNGANQPATGVSWYEAAKFVNWLNSSSGYPLAYKFSSELDQFELWQPEDIGFDATNPFRNSQTHYFLPNFDEWYKAAYYNPQSGTYYNYPNGSDIAPVGVASGTAEDTAVYTVDFNNALTGPAEITQAGGLSPFGTMAQGGNVEEWQETEWDLVNDDASALRLVRGGNWFLSSGALASAITSIGSPINELMQLGLRVASIPELESLMADFDSDGDVDGDDFLAWQGGFGTLTGAQKSDGDYDNDGDVDGDDFLGWQSEFGSGSASGAVPEPAAALLMMILVSAAACFQRCRRAERVSKLVSA